MISSVVAVCLSRGCAVRKLSDPVEFFGCVCPKPPAPKELQDNE